MLKSIKKVIRSYTAFLFLCLIILASNYYLLQSGFFYVHDFPIAARIAEMADIMASGQFPPRWSANFGYGFGMPLFNFYAPLPYVIGAILYYLNNNLIFVIKSLYILINFFTLLGSYKLGKRIGGVMAGLALATIFTLAPYRALLLFVRGALSEAFAISFFPWAMLAVINLQKESYNSKQNFKNHLLLFMSLLSIVLSHNLSALMFIPLLLLYAILTINKHQRLQVLFTFILAGLSASFYIIPAFFEQNFTRVNAIFTDYFDYRLHFVYIRQLFWDNWAYGGSAWGTADDISFFLGYGQLLALITLLLLIVKKFYVTIKKREIKKLLSNQKFKNLLIIFIFFGSTLLLTLQKSQFIWSILPILSYLQFPWRWFGASFFFLATSFSAGLFLIKKSFLRYLLVFFLIIISLFNLKYFRAEKKINNLENYYTDQNQVIASEISKTLPDYIPLQMTDQQILAEFNQQYPQPVIWQENEVNGLVNIEVIKAQLVKKQSHRELWSLALERKQLVNFKLANFPGWKAVVNGNSVNLLTNPRLGNIQLELEAGENKIELFFTENKLRLIADYLSLIGLIGFFIWSYFLQKKTTNH